MKISFDFDSTLSIKEIQDFAIKLKNMGCDIWIVTSRHKEPPYKCTTGVPYINLDLYGVAKVLEIPENNIIFTNGELKSTYFKNKDFLVHIDDDWIEINFINNETETIGIPCFGNKNWREQVLNLLD